MTTHLARLLALALGLFATSALVSCGSGAAAADPVVGSWTLDGTATFEANEDAALETVPVELSESARAAKRSVFEQMKGSITLAADGTFEGTFATMPGAERGMSGTWTHEDERVSLATVEVVGGEPTITPCTLDGDELTCTFPGPGRQPAMTVVFVRGAADASGE